MSILIISEESDISTDKVIDWILSYNKKFTRYNNGINFFKFQINLDSKKELTSSIQKNVIWNRRGYMPITPLELKQTPWWNYLKKEQITPLFILEKSATKIFGSYSDELNNNKLQNLDFAIKCGFDIPKTIVTNNKKDLLNFLEKEKKYITKSLYAPPSLTTKNSIFFGSGTITFNIDEIEDFFATSFVQEYVEKEFEIRVFFFEDKIYPMAIFSTEIDFRNDNEKTCVPFIFDKIESKKIKKLISKISYNTGSIDIILDKNNRYVFLEINPMGQFDWLSHYCNYYIEKDIAEILIKNER